MKLSKPRVSPLTEAEWTDEQRKVLEPVHREGRVYNVRGTLARHWEASKKFGVWGNHVMGDTLTLLPREREILILRIGWLCQAEYEWGQHVVFGKKAGLTDAEIARIKEGPDAAGWGRQSKWTEEECYEERSKKRYEYVTTYTFSRCRLRPVSGLQQWTEAQFRGLSRTC